MAGIEVGVIGTDRYGSIGTAAIGPTLASAWPSAAAPAR